MSKNGQPLGQHWLFDEATLDTIAGSAGLTKADTVLEVGPGLGSLTKVLAPKVKKVIAVEKDQGLVNQLNGVDIGSNVEVLAQDILEFNLSNLPLGYKVVANIPYYLTSKLLRMLLESPNPPKVMSLLVQKEVAERIVATPPKLSVLAFSVQYYAKPEFIKMVPKVLFTPPPQVDSAILKISYRPAPLFPANSKILFRIVKAGFGNRRKQLKNSLVGGLHIPEQAVMKVLLKAGIDPILRAQELTMDQWRILYGALADLVN